MSDNPSGTDPGAPLNHLVAELIGQMAAARSAWERVERQAIPLLERIAAALERGAMATAGATPVQVPTPTIADEVRAAITAQEWDRAGAVVATLRGEAGSGREAAVLAAELDQARARATDDGLARVEAARLARDPDGALLARDDLARLLGGDALRDLDRSIVGWLMKLIQQRLRSIPVGADVARLAAQAADRFGGTPEGSSLRAALPTLRRSAGLCSRCGEPYAGDDEACAKCLDRAGQAPSDPPTLAFVAPPEDDEADIVIERGAPLDLNDDAVWRLPPDSFGP